MNWTKNNKRTAGAVGLLGTGAVAGAIVAAVIPASAATSTPTPSTGSSTAATPRANAQGPAAVRSGETVVTGTKADTLKAAALAAVPGGTVYRVETDADGAAYEAHMTKADGSLVTVKFDSALKVSSVEDGMGAGRPGGAPGPTSSSSSGA